MHKCRQQPRCALQRFLLSQGQPNKVSARQPHQVHMHTDTHSAPWHVMPRADMQSNRKRPACNKRGNPHNIQLVTPDRHTAHHKPDRCAASPSSNIPMSHITVHFCCCRLVPHNNYTTYSNTLTCSSPCSTSQTSRNMPHCTNSPRAIALFKSTCASRSVGRRTVRMHKQPKPLKKAPLI
jgi:hypothetical protein